jgi:hypothetical protein
VQECYGDAAAYLRCLAETEDHLRRARLLLEEDAQAYLARGKALAERAFTPRAVGRIATPASWSQF